MNHHVQNALGFARQASPANSRNLIASDESYRNVLQEIIRPAQDVLHAHKLKGFHELRAAYACERYEQITQYPAPINGGQCCQADRNLDREARRQISYELGHGRIDVVTAYIEGEMTRPLDMEVFLVSVQAGSYATRQRHLRQAKVIQAAIEERWRREAPWVWKRKHLDWFLKHRLAQRSANTRY